MTSSEMVKQKPGRKRGRPKHKDASLIESELLSIAFKEFVRCGYGGTSMAQIVKIAGISKTTLYSRFPSKEVLFRAILQEQVRRIGADTIAKLESNNPQLEQGLIDYAKGMISLSLQGDLLEVNRLIYSEANRFPELGKAAADRTQLGIRRISEFVRQCAIADKIPCKNPNAVAETFIFMLRGYVINIMLTNRKVSAIACEKWVENAVHVLLSSRREW